MRDVEHILQCGCVRWFRLKYPKALIFAIPNGGARNAITGARLKDEGVTAGVPDLFIATPRNKWHGMFVEMKTRTGRLSEAQKVVSMHVVREGYFFAVCRSFDEFAEKVTFYMENADTGEL